MFYKPSRDRYLSNKSSSVWEYACITLSSDIFVQPSSSIDIGLSFVIILLLYSSYSDD